MLTSPSASCSPGEEALGSPTPALLWITETQPEEGAPLHLPQVHEGSYGVALTEGRNNPPSRSPTLTCWGEHGGCHPRMQMSASVGIRAGEDPDGSLLSSAIEFWGQGSARHSLFHCYCSHDSPFCPLQQPLGVTPAPTNTHAQMHQTDACTPLIRVGWVISALYISPVLYFIFGNQIHNSCVQGQCPLYGPILLLPAPLSFSF